MRKRKIILASKSPRRKQILTNMGYEFEVIPSNYEEQLPKQQFKPQMIQELAFFKAQEVAMRVSADSIILGADTVVVHNDLVLGKPNSREDAFRMLKNLSGDRHYVVTGIATIDNLTTNVLKNFEITYVTFHPLSDEIIEDYIEHFKPFDKAGAYGIQELPEGFVKSIEGEFDNVVGFPSKAVAKMITTIMNYV